MITTNNPEALGWKHNHEPGIRCKQNEQGSLDVIGWPDSLPALTQADVDTWETEYQARDTKEEEYSGINSQKLLKAFALVAADQWGITPKQLKNLIKVKL